MTTSIDGQESSDVKTMGEVQTIASIDSAVSNRVTAEQVFHPHQGKKLFCLLPESREESTVGVSPGQCCSVDAYSIDLRNRAFSWFTEVRLSAFICQVNQDGNQTIEFCCDPDAEGINDSKSYFHFDFEDEVKKIHLKPLPINTYLERQTKSAPYSATQAIGVLFIVVSKRAGISVHSLVLTRKSQFEVFRITEFVRISRGDIDDMGDMMKICSTFDHGSARATETQQKSGPVIYIALAACPPQARSCRIDVFACKMVCHKCPLFRFDDMAPCRALKRSILLTDVNRPYGLTISVKEEKGSFICSIVALFERTLKNITLPESHMWSTQTLRSEDIMTVPIKSKGPKQCLGPAASFVEVERNQSTSREVSQFIIFCHPKLRQKFSDQQGSPLNGSKERNNPLFENEITKTRNAVLRTRDSISTNVHDISQKEAGVRKPSFLRSRSDPSAQTPTTRRNFAMTIGPSMVDENVDFGSRPFFSNHAHSSSLNEESFRGDWQNQRRAHLVIVNFYKKTNGRQSQVTTTLASALPPDFSNAEAVCLNTIGEQLILAAKPKSVPEVRVLRMSLLESRNGDALVKSGSVMDPIQLDKTNDNTYVESLDTEEDTNGDLRLRLMRTRRRSTSRGKLSCRLVKYSVDIENMIVRRQAAETNVIEKSDGPDPVVMQKLDMIMNTLLHFERKVDERLTSMERRMAENSRRLTRLETELTSKAEI